MWKKRIKKLDDGDHISRIADITWCTFIIIIIGIIMFVVLIFNCLIVYYMLKFQDLQRLGRSSYKDLKLLWDRLYFPIWIFLFILRISI